MAWSGCSGFEDIDYHGVIEASACEVYQYDFLVDNPGTLSRRHFGCFGCVGKVEIGKLNGVWDYMGEKRREEKDERLLIKSLCTASMKNVTYSVS